MTAEAFCVAREFEPSGPLPFVTDRHYLLYALEGILRLEADGHRWTLPPARAALIRAGQPILVTVLSKLRSASVLFAPTFMESPVTGLSVFDMSPLARELVRECQPFGSETQTLSPYGAKLFDALAAVVHKLAASPTPCVMPVPTTPGLLRALELTEARAASEVTFEQIAVDVGQSPRSLARRFSTELGMTWREALRRIRLTRAVELLALDDTPVTQIALAVGYNSISAFNAAFRDLIGSAPSDYRASFRGHDGK